VYQTNSRGADWVKVKPEYSDQMGENLDLLVLGGWWGKGGRTGKISSLLCGLRDKQEDDGEGERPTWVLHPTWTETDSRHSARSVPE
jgi:DNA ligase-4